MDGREKEIRHRARKSLLFWRFVFTYRLDVVLTYLYYRLMKNIDRHPIIAVIRPKTVERFRRKLVATAAGCLEYSGCRHKQGYGVIEIMWDGVRFPILAHRFAWAIAHGEDPPADKIVCHKCNNPPCCNPDHLYAGTNKTNCEDKFAAGRERHGSPWLGKTGSAHPRHKDYRGS